MRDTAMNAGINFHYLKHSKTEWEKVGNGRNILRINDYLDALRYAGFKAKAADRHIRINRPPAIHEEWGDYDDEDLYCYYAVLIGEKPLSTTEG